MAKSLFTEAHKALVGVLVDARHEVGMLQSDVAARVGKDQSYISNIERCQRRIDLVEFYDIALALDADPKQLFGRIADQITATKDD